MQFDTGAVRSNDADDVAYYLISPIGLRRLAIIYSDHEDVCNFNDEKLCLALCRECINIYLSGDRYRDHLAIALYYLCEAMHISAMGKGTEPLTGYQDIRRYDRISPFALDRIAKRYRMGEIKYGAYNMEKGMPIHDLLNHALRHINMHLANQEDEPGDDNLGGSAWGLLTAMHSEQMWPKLNIGHLRGLDCTLTPEILAKLEENKNAHPIQSVNTHE